MDVQSEFCSRKRCGKHLHVYVVSKYFTYQCTSHCSLTPVRAELNVPNRLFVTIMKVEDLPIRFLATVIQLNEDQDLAFRILRYQSWY